MSGYEKLGKIGEGTYGTVFKARNKDTEQIVALKIVRLDDEDEGVPSSALREICLLRELRHANVVRLQDVVHTNKTLNLVFEFCDLDLRKFFDTLDGQIDQKLVRTLMHQLLSGLCYCHAHNVLHRDLKPQNLLINNSVKTAPQLKLADFGLARPFAATAPKLLPYGIGPRMCSGCIFAEISNCGKPLFPGADVDDQLKRIFKLLGTPLETEWPSMTHLPDYKPYPPYQRPANCWERAMPNAEELARDLLKRLLVCNPQQRIAADAALTHRYFTIAR
uniref:Cell division protein kinase 5 n=1 Tax=Globodera pallida TaxID=36090 RepID=A0A183CE21_GLOPA